MSKRHRDKGWRKKLVAIGPMKISWPKQVRMCASSLNLPWPYPDSNTVAKEVCKALGWTLTNKTDVIQRRATQLAGHHVDPDTHKPGPNLPVAASKPAPKPKKQEYSRPACIPKLGAPHPDYVKDDAFFSSREWKEVRYFALQRAGGACQCCGAKASDGIQLHADHIKPRYKFPHLALDPDNIQCLCGDCNIGKGAWDSTDWREHFKSI